MSINHPTEHMDPEAFVHGVNVCPAMAVCCAQCSHLLSTFLDCKTFHPCAYSSGMRSFHPPTSSFPTPLLHVHRKGKKKEESGREGSLRTDDLLRGASAEELLAQNLSNSLLEEKEENKRFVCPLPVYSFLPSTSCRRRLTVALLSQDSQC